MFLGLLFCTLLFVLLLLSIADVFPSKCVNDYDSPLNWVMYQEPNVKYSDQIVNMWVDKPWRSDARRIPCRWEEGYDAKTPYRQRYVLIYSHGNAENLLHCMQLVRDLASTLQMDVVTWDYSGYGLNDRDRFERSAEGVNLSLLSVVEHVVQEKGYSYSHVFLWGTSLGSGPSIHVARRMSQQQKTPPAGLILFGAFASILSVMDDVTSSPHISKWFQERWDNEANLVHVQCPVLILHGENDMFIQPKHAHRLKKQLPDSQAKLVLIPNAGHNSFSWSDVFQEVKEWRQSIG